MRCTVRESKNVPRDVVASELLEAVYDDRTDLGRVLALLVAETSANIEGLSAHVNRYSTDGRDERTFPDSILHVSEPVEPACLPLPFT